MYAYYVMNSNENDFSRGSYGCIGINHCSHTLVVTDNIDARTIGSDSVVAGSPSGFNTAVCGTDAVHLCQTSAG